MGESSEISRFFTDQGYWRVERAVGEADVAAMAEVVDRDLQEKRQPFRVSHGGRACRLDSLLDRDPVFLSVLRGPVIRPVLEALLGPVVEVSRNRHNHATLNARGDIPVRLHRDVQHWTQSMVSVFVYLEDSTVENGCTLVVPGTHRLPYAGPQSGGGGGNWADEHEEYRHVMNQAVPVEMERGGVLVMNSLCFHSVGRNQSDRTRRSVTFACRSVDELSHSSGSDAVILFGERRYVGNDASLVSGSLRRG